MSAIQTGSGEGSWAIGGGKCTMVKGWVLDFKEINSIMNYFITVSHGDSIKILLKEEIRYFQGVENQKYEA